MPKYVIERQYLVPMYQHMVVEAENLEEACKKGHKKGHQRRYRLGLPGDGLRQRSRDNHHCCQDTYLKDMRPIRPTV